MSVLFIRSNPVDPDSRVEKEVFTLVKEGYKVTILALDRSSNYKVRKEKLEFDSENVTIYRVGYKSTYGGGKKNFLALLRFQMSIISFFYKNRKKIKIIHACDLDTGLISVFLKKLFGVKLVYDIFDYYPDSHGASGFIYKVLSGLERFTINNSNSVILCSENRIYQVGKINTQNIEIIHNTPPMVKLKSEKIRDEKKLKIVYVGVLGNNRMIKELLEIVSESDTFELHIAGFGSLEKFVKDYSKNYNNIIFYGKINYEKTLELENNCDVVTALYDPRVKNHYYAAPNKFYEGLMLGKILVMAKDTGMSQVVRKYDLGEVIDFDKQSLKSSLEKISNYSSEKREYIENKSQEIYNKEFNWMIMEKRLINLYSEVCNSK